MINYIRPGDDQNVTADSDFLEIIPIPNRPAEAGSVIK